MDLFKTTTTATLTFIIGMYQNRQNDELDGEKIRVFLNLIFVFFREYGEYLHSIRHSGNPNNVDMMQESIVATHGFLMEAVRKLIVIIRGGNLGERGFVSISISEIILQVRLPQTISPDNDDIDIYCNTMRRFIESILVNLKDVFDDDFSRKPIVTFYADLCEFYKYIEPYVEDMMKISHKQEFGNIYQDNFDENVFDMFNLCNLIKIRHDEQDCGFLKCEFELLMNICIADIFKPTLNLKPFSPNFIELHREICDLCQ